MQPDNIADDVAAAIGSLSGEEPDEASAPNDTVEPAAAEPVEATGDEGAATEEGRARDDKGRFAADKKLAAQEPAAGSAKVDGANAPPAGTPSTKPNEPAPGVPPAEAHRAPQSWKPAAREEWAKVPPSVQAEVVRREREASVALQESAQSRKTLQALSEAIGPHEHVIRAAGSDLVGAFRSYVQTAAAFQTGSPEQKADRLAMLAREMNLSVEQLDQALVRHYTGQGGVAPGQPSAPVDLSAEVRRQVMAMQAEEKQRAQAAERQRFEAQPPEFYEDVKQDMADLMELGARRGVAMTPQQAYDRAVQYHPEVSAVLRQREAAKAAANAQASTQRKRTAASSVKSSPAGARPAPQPQTVEDDVRAAMAKHAAR